MCRCLSRCPPLDFTRVCLQTEAVPSPLRTSRPPAWQRCCIGACNAEISLTQRVLSSRKSHLCLAELFGVGLLCLFVGSFFFLFCRIFFFPFNCFSAVSRTDLCSCFLPFVRIQWGEDVEAGAGVEGKAGWAGGWERSPRSMEPCPVLHWALRCWCRAGLSEQGSRQGVLLGMEGDAVVFVQRGAWGRCGRSRREQDRVLQGQG